MISKQIGQSAEYYLMYEILRKLNYITKIAPNIGWNSQGSYSPELRAVITKANQEGYTKPSNAELSALDELLTSFLDQFGSDALHLHVQGLGSIQFGTLNLVNPDTLQHTVVGSVTWQNPDGVKNPDGVSVAYIRTGRLVNAYSGIETDISSGIYISESSTAFSTTKTATGARIISGSNVNTSLNPLGTATTGTRQRYAAADSFPNTDMKGLYIQTYNGTQNILYKDWDNVGGGLKDAQTVTPTVPNIANEIYWLARNGNTSGGSSPGNFFPHFSNLLFAITRPLTDSDAGAIKTMWDTFRSGVGLFMAFGMSQYVFGEGNNWTLGL